jgi:DNA repair protein RecO
MNWEDEGYIVNKKKFRENALILEVFTKNFGKVSGIVYGGTSRRIKNHLQLINKIHVVYNSKTNNKIGYFKTELIEPISPKYFNNQKKTICLNSISSIIKILLPENEIQKKIYISLDNFLKNFDDKNWPLNYLNWEIDLIQDLGFGFQFDNLKNKEINNQKTIVIKVDNMDYKIPSFIVSKDYNKTTMLDICSGLNFSRNLMEKQFFQPNNLRFPYSRKLLEEKIL